MAGELLPRGPRHLEVGRPRSFGKCVSRPRNMGGFFSLCSATKCEHVRKYEMGCKIPFWIPAYAGMTKSIRFLLLPFGLELMAERQE